MYKPCKFKTGEKEKMFILMKFFLEIFARIKNVRIFAPVIEKHTTQRQQKNCSMV